MLCNKQITDIFLSIIYIYIIAFIYTPSIASELYTTDERIILASGDNFKAGEEIRIDGDVDWNNIEINENGVCIGCATNDGGEQKVKRDIKTNDITIINNNGETIIYHNGKKSIKRKDKNYLK